MPLSKIRKLQIDEVSVTSDLKKCEEVCYSLSDDSSIQQHCRLFVDLIEDDKVKVTWYPRNNCPSSAVVVSYHSKRKATYYVKNILKCYNPKYTLYAFLYVKSLG